MISFFGKIFSAIAKAITGVVISLGLMSAPVQPQTSITVEPTPIIQEQTVINQDNLIVEPEINDKQTELNPKKSPTAIQVSSQQPQQTEPIEVSPANEIEIPTQASQSPILTPKPPTPTSTPIPSSANIIGALDFDQTSPFVVTRESTKAKISWHSQNLTNCLASGNWNGSKTANGSENLGAAYLKEGSYTYTLLCGTTNGSTISKTLTVNIVSGKPIINLRTNGNTVSALVVNPSSSVKFEWAATIATNEPLQCTANNQQASPIDSKDIIISNSYFAFKLKCTSASGISAEKSVQIKFPGTLVVSTDPSSPQSVSAASDETVVGGSFNLLATNDNITVQELKFRVSQAALPFITNNNLVDDTISVQFGNVEEGTIKILKILISLGNLSNAPTSGINLRLTNTYAKYIRSDGTVITTTTPGPNDTQATSDILILR